MPESKDIYDKIIDLLKSEGIEPKQYKEVLQNTLSSMELMLWEKVILSVPIFCYLKDIIWYNLEHTTSGGLEMGNDDLRFLGTKYPYFMFTGNDDFYIDHEKVKKILPELEDIKKKWSSDWKFVSLYSRSQDGWSAGDANPSPVIIYDGTSPNPNKRGPMQFVTPGKNILSSDGKTMKQSKVDDDTVLCCIMSHSLGRYDQEPVLRSTLDRLIETYSRAFNYNKGVVYNFKEYDYSR